MISPKRQILVSGILKVFIAAGLLFPGLIFAGDLDPTNPPGSTMYTLEDIYDVVSDTNARLESGAPVERTGQVKSYAAGDDGYWKMGVAWPNPRFTDNGDGTVTDNLTGLIWLMDANCFEAAFWADALDECNSLASGSCGLSDDSVAGDWRLPNIKELQSLIDYGRGFPAVHYSHPSFTSVQSEYYWSSTSRGARTGNAWSVDMGEGHVYWAWKESFQRHVWPVRGGN